MPAQGRKGFRFVLVRFLPFVEGAGGEARRGEGRGERHGDGTDLEPPAAQAPRAMDPIMKLLEDDEVPRLTWASLAIFGFLWGVTAGEFDWNRAFLLVPNCAG